MGLPYLPLNIDVTDPGKGGLYTSFSGSTKTSAPLQIRDNGLYMAIRAMQPNTTGTRPWDDIDISTATISVAIDTPDLFPTSGNFFMEYGPTTLGNTNSNTTVNITGSTTGIVNGMSVVGADIPDNTTITISGSTVTLSNAATGTHTGVSLFFYNTTSAIAYSTGSTNLATALNSLSYITLIGGVTVVQTGTDFAVTFVNNGVRNLLAGNVGSLFPLSSIQVIEMQVGTNSLPSIQLIRILQQPATFQDVFTAFPAAAATVTTITAGGSGVNNLQQIVLNPIPYDGTWTITTTYGTSGPIAGTALGSDVQTALNAIATTPTGTWLVSGSASGPYNITNTTGLSIAALTVNVLGLIVPIGVLGELNLATPGLIARFDALVSGTQFSATLEIQLQFPGGDPQTILFAPVTIDREIIRTGAIATPPYPVGATLDQLVSIIDDISQYISETVSAAGSSEPSIHQYAKLITIDMTISAGSGGYTFAEQLAASQRIGGDKCFINIRMPASTNPIIQIKNNSGAVVWTETSTGIAYVRTLIFTFNGIEWNSDQA